MREKATGDTLRRNRDEETEVAGEAQRARKYWRKRLRVRQKLIFFSSYRYPFNSELGRNNEKHLRHYAIK